MRFSMKLGYVLLTLAIIDTMSAIADTALPPTPAPVKAVIAARRFTLETPFPYTWAKEHIEVSTGLLVVIEVDPALVVPRDTLEPVLYAGNLPVQRLNHGNKSGRVIGIIPGNINLATTPIWFGTPQLPERITTAMVESERARAEKAGAARTFKQANILGLSDPPVKSKDLSALLRTVGADLVLKYSPQDKGLAETWRLPEAKKSEPATRAK